MHSWFLSSRSFPCATISEDFEHPLDNGFHKGSLIHNVPGPSASAPPRLLNLPLFHKVVLSAVPPLPLSASPRRSPFLVPFPPALLFLPIGPLPNPYSGTSVLAEAPPGRRLFPPPTNRSSFCVRAQLRRRRGDGPSAFRLSLLGPGH